MDNHRIFIMSDGKEDLDLALKLAFARKKKATHYMIAPRNMNEYTDNGTEYKLGELEEDQSLILFSRHEEGAIRLPFTLTEKNVTEFVWNWLQENPPGEWNDCSFTSDDGSMYVGWMVYNEKWSRIGGMWASFIAIKPIWGMSGK